MLRELPEAAKLGAAARVELRVEIEREMERVDEPLDVDEVAHAMRSRKPGCQFQVDQLLEIDDPVRAAVEAEKEGSGNTTGLGFPSPGYSPEVRKSIRTPVSASRNALAAPGKAGT